VRDPKACLGSGSGCLEKASACLGRASPCLESASPCLGSASACLGNAPACLESSSPCLGGASACLGSASAQANITYCTVLYLLGQDYRYGQAHCVCLSATVHVNMQLDLLRVVLLVQHNAWPRHCDSACHTAGHVMPSTLHATPCYAKRFGLVWSSLAE
jgi:hypothetical protein